MKLIPTRIQSDFNRGYVHNSLRWQSVDSHSQNSVADTRPTTSASTSAEIHYVIVFGYPPDKYSVTTEYFKSIGDTTDPDPNMQITNCFRIGYRDFGEGMRAVKRNGEILGGSYLIGAKWAVSNSINCFTHSSLSFYNWLGPCTCE
jgi:nuclear pore complex protein Nup53